MNWKRFHLVLCMLLLAACATARGEKTRVLIVDGFSNHDWQRTTACLRMLLENEGSYSVDVSTFPARATEAEREAWHPDFKGYDVVIQNTNGGTNGPEWGAGAKKALEQYLAEGGGMLAFHSANNAFPRWPEYNRMIGLGWRPRDYGTSLIITDDEAILRLPPGEGGHTSHGERVDALVTRLGEHPIHAELPRRWRTADVEVYRYVRGPAEHVQVLSYARDPLTGLNFPVEWTVQYGKGRVYTSTLGHVWPGDPSLKGIQCAAFQTLLFRALDWLAGKPVHYAVPGDFPDREKPSLRPLPHILLQMVSP